jgi:hypothetical protein
MVTPKMSLRAERAPGLLNDVVVLRGDGVAADATTYGGQLYIPDRIVTRAIKPVNFTAIPYYAWANREPSAMTVWLGMHIPT